MYLNFDIVQGIIEEDIIFCVSGKPDALWKINRSSRTAELLMWIEKDEVYSKKESYLSAVKTDDKIILIPAKARDFLIYDIASKNVDCIRREEIYDGCKDESNKWMHFFGGYVQGRSVYMMGVSRPYIVSVNIDTSECANIKLDERCFCEEAFYYYTLGACQKGDHVYIPRMGIPEIVKVDIHGRLIESFKFKDCIKKIYGLENLNGSLYALVKKDTGYSLVKWTERGENTEEIIIHQTSENMYWCHPIGIDGCIYIFQSNGVHFYRIDVKNQYVEWLSALSEAVGDPPHPQALFSIRCVGVDHGKIILHTGWNNKWYEYDIKTGNIENYTIQIPEDVYEESRWRVRYQYQEVINEAEFPLKYFLRNF